MDKEKFAEAVRAAEFVMACSAYNGKTSGAAHAMALITHSRDGDGLEENLICLSRSERWAWDAVSAMTQAALRHPYQPISPVLATWAADMLAGNEPRPRVKGKRLVNRDLAIADTIVVLCKLYGLKPTRSLCGHPECCAEGGSACDVVGVAAGMTYKAVERVWSEWGTSGLVHQHEEGDDEVLRGRRSRRRQFWTDGRSNRMRA